MKAIVLLLVSVLFSQFDPRRSRRNKFLYWLAPTIISGVFYAFLLHSLLLGLIFAAITLASMGFFYLGWDRKKPLG